MLKEDFSVFKSSQHQWVAKKIQPKINLKPFLQQRMRSNHWVTTVNLKSKKRTAPTAVIPSIVLITCRSLWEAPTHPRKWQLRQITLGGPTSLENGPSLPKKLMMEEVQVGGARAEHAEHWKAPEIVESVLKCMTLIFRKAFNSKNKETFYNNWKRLSVAWDASSRDKLELTWKSLICIYHLTWTSPSPEVLVSRQIPLLRSAQRCSSPSTSPISITIFMKDIIKLCCRLMSFNAMVVVGS